MLPTINKKFLLKLVLVVALLAGAVVGVHAFQAERIPDALRRLADRNADAGKADAAVKYLRQYLEFRPADADAMERLAGLLRERAHGRASADLLLLYEKVLRTDPARSAVRREALAAALALKRFTDAETHAAALLKEFPDDAGVWRQQARAQAGLSKPAEARDSFEAAVRLAPTDPAAYHELAYYQSDVWNQKAEAVAVLDRLVAARPADPDALVARARRHADEADASRTGAGNAAAAADDKRAIADLRRALDLDPHHANALIDLAGRLSKGRDVPAARDLLAEGMKLYPADARFVRHLSWLELNRGNLGAAVSVLEGALDTVKEPFDLMVPLADLLVQLGDMDRTREIVRKVEGRKDRQSVMQAKYLNGRVAMREGNWDEAVRLFALLRTDAVTENLPGLENQANLLLAVCYGRKGDVDREEDTLKRVTAEPNRLPAVVALGTLYQDTGRFDDAVRQFEDASRSAYASGGTVATTFRLKAARLRVTNASPREWDALFRELSPEVLARLGTASADAAMLQAEMHSHRGLKDRAVATLRAEAQRRPADARLWAILSLAAADVGGVAAGLAFLDEAQAMCGDGPDVRLARATLYARDPARLRPIGPLAEQIDLWQEGDQNRLLAGLIEVYDRAADDAGVIRTYRRMAGRHPTDVALWEALFERATVAKDAAAQAEARAVLAKLPDGNRSAALLAAWEVSAARRATDAPAAISALEAPFGKVPDRTDVCVALARLKAVIGDTAAAGELFARGVRLDPTRFGPTQEYMAFLTSSGNDGELAKLLARLTQDPRWFGEPLLRAVRQTVGRVESVAAKRLLDLARKAVEREPDGLGWLGDCYAACGFAADATACYEKAVAAPAATPDDWLRLAVRTAAAKDEKGVSAVMTRAREKLSAPQFLATAAAFADTPAANGWSPELGGGDERRKFTQSRLAIKLSRYQRGEAIDLLEGFLTGKDVAANDAAWARRNLAMLLAARGTPADRTRATELLADKAAPTGDTADEKRATAAVLAALSRHLGGDERLAVLARAVAVLGDVAKETNATKDKFLLAQLLRTSGRRAEGRKLLGELIAANKNGLDFLVAALDEATEPDDKAFADTCSEHLLALFPNDFRAVAAAARYKCRSGDTTAALGIAVAYSRTSDPTPGDLQARSRRSAELLDEMARQPKVRGTEAGHKMTAAAVEKYEALIVTRPEVLVAAAGLLAADGRADAGFVRIEKYARQLPARVKVLAGLAVLRAGGATDAQFATVRGWLDAAKNEEPNSAAVLLNEGEFCSLTRDAGGLERAYRAAVAADPTNVVALNDLAWALAPRADAADEALRLVEQAVGQIGLTGELLDTRARVRIAQKKYDAAEQDLRQALAIDRTPLRLFHLAVAQADHAPADARASFAEAVKQGLTEANVHPLDAAAFRGLKEQGGKAG